MEQSQIWQIIIVFILGGIFVFLLLALIPLVKQLKKTAYRLEIAAATLDKVLNSEVKNLLNRGEKVLGEFEEIPPLVKDKLTHIPAKATRSALTGIGGHLTRALVLWTLKEGWRRLRGKRKKGGS